MTPKQIIADHFAMFKFEAATGVTGQEYDFYQITQNICPRFDTR
jgi:hypothetical protein